MEKGTVTYSAMQVFRNIGHAAKMVRRNLRSYRLLSVTIILSFALLLGYLGFVDSTNYNRYKEVFAQDRSLVFSVAPTDNYRDRILREKASKIGLTNSILLYGVHGLKLQIPNVVLSSGEAMIDFGFPTITLVPSYAPIVYETETDKNYTFDPIEITWIDGKEHEDVSLAPDEIVIDNQLYEAIGNTNKGMPHIILIDMDLARKTDAVFRIVGTIPSKSRMDIAIGDGAQKGKASLKGDYKPHLLLSNEVIHPEELQDGSCTSLVAFVTDQPELIAKLIESVNPNNAAIGAFKAQDRAKETMKTANRTKALICCAMLVILGINLYSCFENALNARRFEIGVKRAIGASAMRIVQQFLLESILVMIANIVISVSLVADIFVVYKYLYERTPNEYGQFLRWTIYISRYSVVMFSVCTIALTLAFSIIFAYRSTQVRIADQLKAE